MADLVLQKYLEALADGDGQFEDTGMTYAEALRRAEKWWNIIRGYVRKDFNTSKGKPRTVPPGSRGAGLIIPGETWEEIPSGILSGKRWNKLNAIERGRVAAAWHHFHIRVPLHTEAP